MYINKTSSQPPKYSEFRFTRKMNRHVTKVPKIASLAGDEIAFWSIVRQKSRGPTSEEKRPSQRMGSVRFLSDVGKEECEMFAAHPSFDSRSSYHLALLRRLFRLLSLISEISVAIRRARSTPREEDGWLSMTADLRARVRIDFYPIPRMIYLHGSLPKIRPESKTIRPDALFRIPSAARILRG